MEGIVEQTPNAEMASVSVLRASLVIPTISALERDLFQVGYY